MGACINKDAFISRRLTIVKWRRKATDDVEGDASDTDDDDDNDDGGNDDDDDDEHKEDDDDDAEDYDAGGEDLVIHR